MIVKQQKQWVIIATDNGIGYSSVDKYETDCAGYLRTTDKTFSPGEWFDDQQVAMETAIDMSFECDTNYVGYTF